MKFSNNSQFNILTFLIGLNSIIFFLAFAASASQELTGKDQVLVFGAFNAFVFRDGNFWLAVTSTFLHFGFFHFLFNMLALNFIGKLILEYYDSKKLFITYILGGISGNIFTYFLAISTNENSLTIGASGAIWALIGLIIGGIIKKDRYGNNIPLELSSFYPILIPSVIISFLPNVSWTSHLGGFLLGVTIGFVFKNSLNFHERMKEKNIVNALYYLCILAFVGSYLALFINLIFGEG